MVRKRQKTKEVKQEKVAKVVDKPQLTAQQLIRRNGTLVEDLLKTDVWIEIVEPLIDESIASVTGRKTNGRWYHGSFTKLTNYSLESQRGYQQALMELNNRLKDFVVAKDNLKKKEINAANEKLAPMVNPFLEEFDEKD